MLVQTTGKPYRQTIDKKMSTHDFAVPVCIVTPFAFYNYKCNTFFYNSIKPVFQNGNLFENYYILLM